MRSSRREFVDCGFFEQASSEKRLGSRGRELHTIQSREVPSSPAIRACGVACLVPLAFLFWGGGDDWLPRGRGDGHRVIRWQARDPLIELGDDIAGALS